MYDKLLNLFGKAKIPIFIIETDYEEITTLDCMVGGKKWDSKEKQPVFKVQSGKNVIEEMTESVYVERFLYNEIRDITRKKYRPSEIFDESSERDWKLFKKLQRDFKFNKQLSIPNAFLGIEYAYLKYPKTDPKAIVYYPCVGKTEKDKQEHYMAISKRHRKYGPCSLVDMDWLLLEEDNKSVSALIEFKNEKFKRKKQYLDKINEEPLAILANKINASFMKIAYTKGKYDDFRVVHQVIGKSKDLTTFLKKLLDK